MIFRPLRATRSCFLLTRSIGPHVCFRPCLQKSSQMYRRGEKSWLTTLHVPLPLTVPPIAPNFLSVWSLIHLFSLSTPNVVWGLWTVLYYMYTYNIFRGITIHLQAGMTCFSSLGSLQQELLTSSLGTNWSCFSLSLSLWPCWGSIISRGEVPSHVEPYFLRHTILHILFLLLWNLEQKNMS